MMAQQTQLLEIAGKNALQLLRDHQKQMAPSLLDTIDEEIQQTKEEDHVWKSQINERNYSAMRQVELMWRRTERFVDSLEVPVQQEEIKEGAMNYIKKGKELVHQRLKVIRFADKDGWSAALNYLGDNIAETEAEGKAMRKSKKEAERSRETNSRALVRYNPYQGNSRRTQPSSSRDRDDYSSSSYSGYRQRPSDRSRNNQKKCFNCQRWGHIARDCDQA